MFHNGVLFTISNGAQSPRKELLHNIDLLTTKHGKRLNISQFDNRIAAAIRVGNWKLVTGNPGKTTPNMCHYANRIVTASTGKQFLN